MAKTFALDDAGVVVVIGSGAGGGTLANELAQRGVDKVVILEAGKLYKYDDFVNDEFTMFGKLTWLDKRISAGSAGLADYSPNLPQWTGKGVGGATLHWTAISCRLRPFEFKAKTNYGSIVGANLLDWPISYDDLEPYYTLAEKKMGVAGSKGSGLPPLPNNNHQLAVEAGARKIGYSKFGHPGAINSREYDGRPGCKQIGFCIQGCKIGAKWSTGYVEIPKALATGRAELRSECMALQIQHDKSGKVTGVLYADKDGKHQLQKARVVCVAGNAIETSRLLLNSASSMFPHGLANSSGQVGRNYMSHATGAAISIHKKPVHAYRGTAASGVIYDEAIHDPKRGFASGYNLVPISLGLPYSAYFMKPPSGWGRELASAIELYDHFTMVWISGEDMPQEQNGITLHPTEKDQYGLPVPVVAKSNHDNDDKISRHAHAQWRKLNEAIGSNRTVRIPDWPAASTVGVCRMSANPRDGVLNKWGRAHEIKNLYVSDGSQFTTSGSQSATLTIVTLAIRQAEHIADAMKKMEI